MIYRLRRFLFLLHLWRIGVARPTWDRDDEFAGWEMTRCGWIAMDSWEQRNGVQP